MLKKYAESITCQTQAQQATTQGHVYLNATLRSNTNTLLLLLSFLFSLLLLLLLLVVVLQW